MKKLLLLVVLAFAIYGVLDEKGALSGSVSTEQGTAGDTQLTQVFEQRKSDVQVRGQGIVVKVLSDDLKGSRHQRFILELGTGRTVLIAHNIDLAPRINGLREGDQVEFHGEYEWNEQGGVVHWTHHDPRGSHQGGWLRHNGDTYQ